MRLLHSADWHLGRIFNGRSLLDDQVGILRQFVGLVREHRPDAVLIAGDVYDRAVPPPEAVRLLNDVLAEIVNELETPVVLIAGNHDSGERLGFGARLLASRGLHLAGPAGESALLRLEDEHGPVDIIGLPYAEPSVVRALHGHESSLDHASAMRLQLDALRARANPAPRSVLVAHAFVIGGETSDSERLLSVGGSSVMAADVFEGFDFVALGHLHRPQTLADGRVHYAGSLMKYSLSEVAHLKSVSLIDIDAAGQVQIGTIPLRAPRELRVIEGELASLLELGRSDPRAGDYVHARLTDTGALLEPMARLREVYPNALSVERVVLAQTGDGVVRQSGRPQLQPADLFAAFLRDVADEELDDARRRAFEQVLQTIHPDERNPA